MNTILIGVDRNMPISSKEFALQLLQCQGKLLTLLHCTVFERQDIPDLLQEINVHLLDKEEEYNPEFDFFPWAAQRARYVVKSYLRDKRRSRIEYNDRLINLLCDTAVQFTEESEQEKRLLRQCVEKLPRKQRFFFDLHYEQGFKPLQIAAKLQKNANAIRQTLHRIRIALIQCVETKRVDNRDL